MPRQATRLASFCDAHRRLVKLVEVWMRDVHANLLRAQPVLKEEVCSLLAYPAE